MSYNDPYGREPTGSTDGAPQDYVAKENSREGRLGDYGGLNGTLLAPDSNDGRHRSARRGSDADTNDVYGRSRADRGNMNTSNNSRNGRSDMVDPKSSTVYGSGPGARQIEGQQLLRRRI
jgi:hypothetical protein